MNKTILILLSISLSLSVLNAQHRGLMPSSTPIMNPPLSYEDSIVNRGQGDLKVFVENYYNAYKIFKWGTKNQSRCTIGHVLVDDGNQTKSCWIDSLATIEVDKIISVEIMADDVLTTALYGSIGAECGIIKLKIKRKEDK